MTGPLDDVADHPVVQAGARLGYVVSGVIHLLVGLLAVRLASGDNSSDADQSGALAALAASPLGMVLLATTATGLALLAVTQLARAVSTGKSTDRVKAASKAVAYLALAAGAAGFLLGRESSSVEQSRSFTAMLMALPAGVALVVAVGLVVLGIGGYHLYKGAGRRFRRDLTEEPPRGIVVLGIIGYVAKGVALDVGRRCSTRSRGRRPPPATRPRTSAPAWCSSRWSAWSRAAGGWR